MGSRDPFARGAAKIAASLGLGRMDRDESAPRSASVLTMNELIRSTVWVVMRPPNRRRETSLPSLTTRRPNVLSAMPIRWQNAAISARSASLLARRARGARVGFDRALSIGDPPSAHLT